MPGLPMNALTPRRAGASAPVPPTLAGGDMPLPIPAFPDQVKSIDESGRISSCACPGRPIQSTAVYSVRWLV